MIISQHCGGTTNSWAIRLGPLIGHGRTALMGHVHFYYQQLGSLAHLLPYVDPDNPQELVAHARTLLQLYKLMQRAEPNAESQQQQEEQGQ